ncbi:DNA repair protein RAD51 homolog 2-like [Daphnia carinata]|uniref:DNA repair protein RAD51 homolog 2-like n=1 Tax=Daphnia carinata TaxID=120202 RepID=UPI00257C4113|nr:DNA repair protein RAD51 homolog 2-like [Daphnia carinata]
MTNNLKLKAIGLPTAITDKLANHSIITVQDYLILNLIELQRKTGLSYQKLSSTSEDVNNFIAPLGISVSRLLQPSHVVFNDDLDTFLKGGITCGHITEFSGAPGLGKTQLCLQLALSNALHGKVNGVLYIDSEGAFSASRLLDIAVHKYGIATEKDIQSSLNRIHLWRPLSLKEIIDKLISIEVLIVKEHIGLLIIDSMGSIVRRDFGADKSIERGAQMCSLSSSLKRIAHDFNLAVVVTNHVTAKVESSSTNFNCQSTSIPALGPSWSHWINSRLHLFIAQNKRRLMVSKSPEIPELIVDYNISKGGLDIQHDTCSSSAY